VCRAGAPPPPTPVVFFFHRLWLRREAIDPLSYKDSVKRAQSVFVTHFRVCVCVCVDKASIEGHDHVPRRLEWKRERGKNIHRRKTGSFLGCALRPLSPRSVVGALSLCV
jgi:hypothetical protein